MKKHIKISCLIIATLLAASCAKHVESPAPTAPAGPISYDFITKIYSDRESSPQNLQTHSLKSSSGGCSSYEDMRMGGIAAQSVGLLVPGLGAFGKALVVGGLLTHAVPTTMNSACMTSTVNNMNTELATQESQIQQLQANMTAMQNTFYQTVYQASIMNANTWQYSYQLQFSNIVGNGNGIMGLYASYMMDIGFWSPNGITVESLNLSAIATNTTTMQQAANYINSQQLTAQTAIANLSGSQYAYESCNGSGNCYQFVKVNADVDSSNALLQLYPALFESLEASNNLIMSSESNVNLVPEFDNYNNTIALIYIQGLMAAQDLYYIDFINNQLNYYNGLQVQESGGTQVQIDSLSQVPFTHFTYNQELSQESNMAAYNQAQLQLSLYFGAVVNQMYINTLNYIYTDLPISPYESWPVESTLSYESIPYTYQTVNYESVVGVFVSTPVLKYISNSTYTNNTMIYQYSGLNDLSGYMSALESYISANANNLSALNLESALGNINYNPILYDSVTGAAYNASTLNGTTFIPYYYNESGIQGLYYTNAVESTNNLQQCGGFSGLAINTMNSAYEYGYISTPALFCGSTTTNNSQYIGFTTTVSNSYDPLPNVVVTLVFNNLVNPSGYSVSSWVYMGSCEYLNGALFGLYYCYNNEKQSTASVDMELGLTGLDGNLNIPIYYSDWNNTKGRVVQSTAAIEAGTLPVGLYCTSVPGSLSANCYSFVSNNYYNLVVSGAFMSTGCPYTSTHMECSTSEITLSQYYP